MTKKIRAISVDLPRVLISTAKCRNATDASGLFAVNAPRLIMTSWAILVDT